MFFFRSKLISVHTFNIITDFTAKYLTDFMKMLIVSPSINHIHKIAIWCFFGLSLIFCATCLIITFYSILKIPHFLDNIKLYDGGAGRP